MVLYECQIFLRLFFLGHWVENVKQTLPGIIIIFSAHKKDNYLLFVSSRFFFLTLKQYFAIADRDRCNLCDTSKIYRKHV